MSINPNSLKELQKNPFEKCFDVAMTTVPTTQTWQSMIFSAFRYALGRRTYIVGTTCDYIIANINCFDKKWLHLLREETKRFMDEHYENPKIAQADDCDMEHWEALYNCVVSRLQELGETL